MVGKNISHYRIVREIGRGGMGVVYEAEDLKLGRHVALKFLPAEMASNHQALERFQFEARTASALNHENICTVYEIDEFEGQPFLALELLKGQPLSERLARPLSLDTLLDIGTQVADGLDAAHRAGFVHRDIKPANIFITERGRAKVLDFGLAKLARARLEANAAAGATVDEPRAALLTSPGSTVGTVAYMSPEQARGEDLDARSDLFSLGGVLYQMSTGRWPFEGPTSAVIFHGILEKLPVAPSRSNPELPVKLDEIILKALEKDPDLRYQSAADIRGDLKRLKRDTSSAKVVADAASSGSIAAAAVPKGSSGGVVVQSAPASSSSVLIAEARRHKGVFIGLALAGLILIAAAGFGIFKLLNRSALALDTRNLSIRQLTDHGQVVPGTATVSADGKWIAYARRERERSLRVKQVLTGSEVTVVPAQTGFFNIAAGATSFTPDGNFLYYAHTDPANINNTNLYAVPSLGGPSRLVVSDVTGAGAFSPDGKHIAYRRAVQEQGEDQILIANADGSEERVVFRRSSGTTGLSSNVSWSPSGDLLAVAAAEIGPHSLSRMLVLTPEGKTVRSFLSPVYIADVAWLSNPSGLFFGGVEVTAPNRNQIWFQPYPSGEQSKVTNDLNPYASLSVGGDGKILVATQQRPSATVYVGDVPSVLKDKIQWTFAPISTEQASGYWLSWNGAGKLLQQDGALHVSVTEADGSSRTPLLESDALDLRPNACGPGDMVVLSRGTTSDNRLSVWRLNTVTGETRRLSSGKGDQDSGSCTPDGKWVVYHGLQESDGFLHIFKVSIDGGQPVELAHGNVGSPSVSPDGRFVAYTQLEGQGPSSKLKFVVQKVEGGAPVQELDAPFNIDVVGWTPDGRNLSYVRLAGKAGNLYIQPLAGGPPIQLTNMDAEPSNIIAYAWSRDGKKIAITRARLSDTDVVMFSGFH